MAEELDIAPEDKLEITIDDSLEAETDDTVVLDEDTNADANVQAEQEAKIRKTSDNISKDLDSKLSPAEKKKIEENKNKPKKEIEKIDDFGDYKLSKKELKDALSITGDFTAFIKDKVDIEPNTGKIETLPTGIDYLDAILGGGFGLGTLAVIAGNPGTFKSSLLGQIIGNSQKKFKGKMLSTYLDSENAMTMERLYQLGVANPPIKPYSDITVEGIFKTIEALCAFKALKDMPEVPAIVAWDSVANTTTDYEKADAETSINSVIGLRARILSFVLPRYVSKLREYNMSLIAVNQLRDTIAMGPYAPAADLRWMGKKNMPGGNALKFNAFHLVLLKIKGDLKVEQWGFNGIVLEAKCIKNKLFTPNIPIELIVDFNSGISNFWTNFHMLKTHGYIKGAAWQQFISNPDMKWQATKGYLKQYESSPEFREVVARNVSLCLETEIISKHKAAEIPEELLNG